MSDTIFSMDTGDSTAHPKFATQQDAVINGVTHNVSANNSPSQSLIEMCRIIAKYSKPGFLSAGEASQILLSIVELMSDGVESDALKFSSRFLTGSDYEDIVVERNILHRCGYPICDKDPKGIHKAHQINYRTPKMILPSTYLSKYCTKEHYQASTFFASQLSDASLFSRKDVTLLPYGASTEYELQIALMEEVQVLSQSQNRSMQDIIQELKSLSLSKQQSQIDTLPSTQPRRYSSANPADPHLVDLSDQIKAFKIVERDPSIPTLDAGDEPIEEAIASGVEGYNSRFGRSV
ncbi:Rtr1p [Sugiyamaella lignohabitans]|uniref:RNA polymerase II subunit B1 CTD phosphatase RPAP2 homolog n=1 Tax=Sugiyamaella lignohabitans TaxID=796027 RepID=A0A167EU39_9ASCO|nr:Rtr1p [Sugiyamaella lignohabitans]ANB14456.1 Rtr1p [Sugiyamaella lignohabitans]